MAVRVGFEPTVPFLVRIFSKDVLSTTQSPHRLFEEGQIEDENRSSASSRLVGRGSQEKNREPAFRQPDSGFSVNSKGRKKPERESRSGFVKLSQKF